ncbi:MAG: OmpA family protein [Zhongshania sp.]|uniref:OmpA family protein n=1 Tax=Zhongshania sp. TaxID=1971902 RepID=UPI00260B9B59|nr:OmpA family protein [Zhongshania sp.]MDF1694124.1 OmpA family protein [Zhongshania sp.]
MSLDRFRTLISIGCAFFMSLPAAAIAEQPAAVPHIYALGTLSNVDSNRNVDSSSNGWQLGIGYPINERLYIEGVYFDNTFETGDGNGSDFYQSGFGVDLQYGFNDRETFTPFLLIGVGAAQNDVVPDFLDEDSIYFNAGVGFVGRILDYQWLRYRGEARYVQDDYLNGMSDIRFGLGLEIALGHRSTTREVVREKIIYQQVQVKPKDSDGDHIVDEYDQCPNTLPGVRVDSTGCAIEQQSLAIKNITFHTNSAELTPLGEQTLMAATEFLNSQKNIQLEVAGHTDNVGSDAYNLGLSQKRATAVRQFLISHGIATSRVSAKGYGEAMPLVTNATPEGRAINRRVEFSLSTR